MPCLAVGFDSTSARCEEAAVLHVVGMKVYICRRLWPGGKF